MANRDLSDEAEYRFLSMPGASLDVRLAPASRGGQELQLFGNRAGLLSLANALFWFRTNGWRREFLSLHELPFVAVSGSVSVCLHLTAEDGTGHEGLIIRTDRGEQFEWIFGANDLLRVALTIHDLACNPPHEYDLLQVAEGSAIGVHVRMTDAADWITVLDSA